MWHFRKGQPLRLGCPSIFITSPRVIWKLAAPIFVPLLCFTSHFGLPPIPPHVHLYFYFAPRPVSCHIFFFFVPGGGISILLALTGKKLSLLGIREANIRFNTHPKGLGDPAGGPKGSMSTPAVWTALTERRANTNVINTSALAAGMRGCVCVCV